MYPTQHAALTAGAAIPLRLRGWSWRDVALFWATGWLIDVDHYLSYVWRTGDFSLVNAYAFHKSVTPRTRGWGFHPRPVELWPAGHRPFHALSLLVALVLLSRVVPWLRPVAWGAVTHRLEDLVWEWCAVKQPIPVERRRPGDEAGATRMSNLPDRVGDALQSSAAG